MFRFDIDQDTRSIADLMRDFAQSATSEERRTDEEGSVPRTLRQAAEEAGLLDLGRPESAGGLGLSAFSEGHAIAALVEALPTIGTALLWPEEAGVFGGASGERLADGGGGVAGFERLASLRASAGRVAGTAMLAPGGQGGYLAVARSGAGDRLYRVPASSFTPIPSMGQRALALSSVAFDSNAEEISEFGVSQRTRLFLRRAPFFHGYGRAALTYARDYAAGRQAFGRLIGSFQGVAFLLADVAMELEAAELLWQEAATSQDAALGLRLAADALRAAKDAAYFAANSCVGILGGHGFVDDHPAERWLRDVETLSTLAANPHALRAAAAFTEAGAEEAEGIA